MQPLPTPDQVICHGDKLKIIFPNLKALDLRSPTVERQDTRGLVVQTIKNGDGITFPQKGDRISVHYTGKLAANGRKFDSTYDRPWDEVGW